MPVGIPITGILVDWFEPWVDEICTGSIFNADFGLTNNERLEGFQFLAKSIRQLLNQHSVCLPNVIITDYDKQMKAALAYEFADVQQQLCIHHINSNVMLKAKQKWVKGVRLEGVTGNSSDHEDDNEPSRTLRTELSDEDQAYIHTPASDSIPHTYHGLFAM
ncbi:PKS-NRPS hybrid synthetase [Colletotrichum aenigma]|uniref:PKS-NRPS hybrid synthetase n=1 Tax=Colletotrichum aenigma TaxID=1215731 RepID=UPI0018726A2C|nr:PKS-NRPS hybrid synthetase [Colletotrichum aenigma]KAF5485432.1 PKS-NRPS hybrid synthetase [Colletotrichum aenigma]